MYSSWPVFCNGKFNYTLVLPTEHLLCVCCALAGMQESGRNRSAPKCTAPSGKWPQSDLPLLVKAVCLTRIGTLRLGAHRTSWVSKYSLSA